MRKIPQSHYFLVIADYSVYLTTEPYLSIPLDHSKHGIIFRERCQIIVFAKN